MSHFFKNLIYGLIGVFIFLYLTKDSRMTQVQKNGFAGAILMSTFLLNKRQGIKCLVCGKWNHPKRNICSNKDCKFNLKIKRPEKIKTEKDLFLSKLEEQKQITKICPFCAEEIKKDAIKCKHCMERLDK